MHRDATRYGARLMTSAALETQPHALNSYEVGIAYVDKKYVPIREAKISVLDFGFTHSDVTYDVVHVWDGKFFQLEAHLDRFFESMAKLRLSPGLTRDEVRAILTECVRKSGLKNSYVGMVCTRGVPPMGSRDMRTCTNEFIAYALPFIWIAPAEKRKKGMHAIISSYTRIPSRSVDQTIKNYHWLDLVRSQWEAYDKGADTAFLLDLDGNVTEGPGYNVFLVRNGELATAKSNVLHGVTRKSVLALAKELGIPAVETDIKPEDLYAADEVFITSTGGGIMPITRVDGRIFGNDTPGPITKSIEEQYWQRHAEDWNGTPIDYAA
jgi:branched-chain amino acid aminotransferase